MYEKYFLLSFVYFVPFDTVCPGILTVLQFDLWQEVDPDVIRFCSVYIVFQGCSWQTGRMKLSIPISNKI